MAIDEWGNEMSEPIRILHMIGSLNIGGSQAMILNLYRKVDKNRIQFDFIIDHPDHLYYKDELESMGAKIYVFPSFNLRNVISIKHFWNDFFKAHPEYKVLHSHVRSYASIYLPVAKKNGLITIIHSHSTSNGSGVSSFVKSIMQYPLRYQADYFFACSLEAGKWLFGEKVVKTERFYVVRNAIDAKHYIYNREIHDLYRKQLHIPFDSIVYTHVGRFHAAKNHDFLIDLFKSLYAKNHNSFLVLVGDGDEKERIEDKVNTLGLQDRVLFIGATSNVNAYLQIADYFLFPSLWEGLGISAIEAQAAGLPCVCSDNIPVDVGVTDQCYFVPLNIEDWINVISSISSKRFDAYETIVKSGYDIGTSVRWLEDFYTQVWDRK